METASESDAKAPWLLDQVRDAIARKHYSRRTVQDQLGHSSVETTMICTHVMNKGGRGVTSPLDGIDARG